MIALYDLTEAALRQMLAEKQDFCTTYSLFKHGSRQATLKLAGQLGQKIQQQHGQTGYSLATLSAKDQPRGSFYLAKTLAEVMDHGVDFAFAARRVKPRFNYSKLNYKQRQESFKGALEWEVSPKQRKVILVDDSVVTGASVEALRQLLQFGGYQLLDEAFLCYLRDWQNPTVESDLNTAAISSVMDLVAIIARDDWLPNISGLKFVLDEYVRYQQAILQALSVAQLEAFLQLARNAEPMLGDEQLLALQQLAKDIRKL